MLSRTISIRPYFPKLFFFLMGTLAAVDESVSWLTFLDCAENVTDNSLSERFSFRSKVPLTFAERCWIKMSIAPLVLLEAKTVQIT